MSKVTLAALRLPAGRFSPILSSFSLRDRPPFLDFALLHRKTGIEKGGLGEHLLLLWLPPSHDPNTSLPREGNKGFRHKGWDSWLWEAQDQLLLKAESQILGWCFGCFHI